MQNNKFYYVSAICALFLISIGCDSGSKSKSSEKSETKNNAKHSLLSHYDSFVRLDLDSVKKVYGEKFEELRIIINRYDPVGLIQEGSPNDEYDPEIKTIIVQLHAEMQEEQIQNLVYNEFVRWFDDSLTVGPKNSYEDLANEIYKWQNSLE